MEKTYIGIVDVPTEEGPARPEDNRMVSYIDQTYSVDYESVVLRPISEITVCSHLDKVSCLSVNAVWDTGSTQSAISERLVKKLECSPIGVKSCINPSDKTVVNRCRYIVSVKIADINFLNLEVVEYPLNNHDVDFLIGMDIISQGEFTIRNNNGKTQLLFKSK